jgi:competence ComEA-like helix-hairpin-helix protein
MNLKFIPKILFGNYIIFYIFFLITNVFGETWSKHYIDSLPDSAFAIVEIREDGKKIRHLPHHNHLGELDIPHLKSALGRIYQVKWLDPNNFEKAKKHLEEHYQAYKLEKIRARGLKSPININEASIKELMKLPSIDKKIAKAIIEYRNANGNFKNITDIKNVKEITTNIFSEIEDLITVEEP